MRGRIQTSIAQLLDREFLLQPTAQVARQLLGQQLLINDAKPRRLKIVETEAYLGITDHACHSFGGRRTARVEPMYAQAGTAYVYMIYGIHCCFNVVTGPVGSPEAVLVRALESDVSEEARLLAGPGKLCRELHIDRGLSGSDLLAAGRVVLAQGESVVDRQVVRAARIGVENYGSKARRAKLRFYIRGHPAVSR